MTKRIKRKISLLLLNIQLLFTFFLPLSPLIPQALASEEAPFAIEQIEESYNAYYLVDGVVFAESVDGTVPSFASESGEDHINYDVDRLVIKTASQTYLLEDGKLVDQHSSDSVDLSDSDKNFLYNQWTVSDLLAETENEVELGVEYSFPLNEEVKVTFTKLPEERSTLRIEEVALPEELQEQLDTVSAYAYDITTDMVDGEFEFDLILPVEEEVEEVEVKYAESIEELENDAKEVEKEVKVDGNKAKVEAVDHMTLFIVVKVGSVGITLPFEGADDNLGDIWVYQANSGADTDLITDPTGSLTEDLGTEVVSMNAPGLGRSFLGYTGFTGGTLAETDLAEISWMKYAAETGNDHYLNLFMYKGIDWASVAIVPNCSETGSWELCSTNDASVAVRYHHYNTSGWPWNWHWETNTYNFASFSDLMDSSFGDWRFYNDSDTSSSLTIVSGSSTTASDLLNYIDGVRFLYEDGSDDFYNFESEWDVTRATVSFSPVAPSVINTTWTMDIEFSEDVTDLDSSDLSLTNATVNSLTRIDESTFQVELAAIADGTVSLQVPQDAVVDMAGHGNAVSDVYSYQVDTVTPIVSNIKMFVNGVESTFMRAGDTVRVEADVADLASGVGSVRLLAKNSSGPGYIDSGYFIHVSGDKYAREFTFPADAKYIDLHTAITTNIDGLRFYIKAFDQAGNYTNSVTTSFTYDNAIPEMNNIRMFISTDGTTYVEKDVVKAGDFVRIEVEATDSSSGVKNVEFRIQNKNTGEYVAPRVYEAIPVSGNIYRYSFQIPTDGEYINTHGLMSEAIDEHSFWARATDNVGNYNHGVRGEFTYDNTAPDAPVGLHILDHQGNDLGCEGFTNNRNITIDWADSLDLGFDHFLLDLKDKDSHRSLTSSFYNARVRDIDGYYRYKIRQVDQAGHISNPSVWCGVTLDRISPDVVLTNPTTSLLNGNIEVRGSVTDLNPHHYWLVVTNSEGNNIAGPGVVNETNSFVDKLLFNWDTTLLDDDDYTIKLEARDSADNKDVGSIDWKIVTVDNTAPTVDLAIDPATPDGDNDWYITNPEITLLATDVHNIDRIEYQWGSTAGVWTEYAAPFNLPNDGTLNLYYRAFDELGNESQTYMREIKMDREVPTVPLSVDADPELSGGPDVEVTWNDASDNVGIDHYIITFDNLDGDEDFSETVASNVNDFSTDQVEAEGTWRITVTAYDFAGNESASDSDDIVIDKTAPAAPVLSLGGTRDGEVDLSWTTIADADSYIILYGLLPGDYLYAANVGDVTSYTVQGLGTGDYYFVVRAMDDSDNQSGNSNEVGTALVGVGGVIAEGFEDAENVLGVEDEASEEEQAAMIEEIGGEVAGANSCEQARVWFWLGLAITFIAIFFSAFLKKGWQKILAFILIPAIAAIVYSRFLGGACFNSSMMTWMNEVYWVPVYLTAIMAKLVTLFFVED